ncbi:FtsX-like permease family protein [Sporosarcina sp. FA9]|uniref:FtsX-like permease family protein n=1 Tax=Sporosarcina sp. FA9 TaxID=3413030 RepID=UPI003F65AD5B
MKSLSSLALRLFRTNKFIVFTSMMSIAIAVSLVITMSVFSANAKQALQDEMKALYGELDLAVVYDDTNIIQNKTALYNFVADHPGTELITEVLVTQAHVHPLGGEVYTVGIENNRLAQSRYKTTETLEKDSVIMTAELADSLNLSVGDNVEIEDSMFSLIEIIENAKGTGIATDILIFALDTAHSFKNLEERFSKFETTALMIKAKKDIDVVSMAVDLKKFNEELRIDIMAQNEFATSNMSSLNTFIIVMSVLILIVTSLMVISNFDLFMYKNRNQFAIMRAMGAKTKQISRIVFIQSIIINSTGIILGLLIAIVGNKVVQSALERFFSLEVSTAPFNLGVAGGVVLISAVIIQLFLYVPVYKSSKMLPLMMMQDNEKIDFGHQGVRRKIGKLLMGSATFVILFGMLLAKDGGIRALSILFGAVLLLASLFTLFPIYIAPLLRSLLPATRKLFGKEAYIAVQNFIPQVRKNTFVILSISILMIITVFGSVLMTTIQQSNVQYIDSQFPTSIIMKSRIYETDIDAVKLSEEVRTGLPDVQVSAVSNFGGAELLVDERRISFSYVFGDLEGFKNMGLLPEVSGSRAEAVILSPEFAKSQKLNVGDALDIGMYSNEKQGIEYVTTMIVGAITDTIINSDVLFDWQVSAMKGEFTAFDRLFVRAGDEQGAVLALESFKSQYPELQISTHSKSLEEASAMFLQRWSIFIAVLIALVLSVMAGIFNTLVNNIYSKRKEFAVLRTVGVRPQGVVKIIITQIVLYVMIGLLFGVVCGLLLSFVISLIDPGGYAVDMVIILSVALSMLVMSIVLFIPIGRKIGNQNISVEVLHDNK